MPIFFQGRSKNIKHTALTFRRKEKHKNCDTVNCRLCGEN